MGTRADYIVVGAGLTGGTIARLLADQGREVLIVERRNHLGGNVHDSTHHSRIRVHTYGPHYFRCSSRRVWDFVQRFSRFYRYEATVKAVVHGSYQDWPLNRSMLSNFPDWEKSRPAGPPKNFEEACLLKMPRTLYEEYVRGYTRKQWGVDPSTLDAELAERVRMNDQRHTTLTPEHRFQGLPALGYAGMVENLLAGIPCVLGTDYLKNRSEYQARKALVFSGSLDEFFGFDAGRLGYRSQRRILRYLPDAEHYQPCAQVNHPLSGEASPLRTIEWKYLMPPDERSQTHGTVITEEHPFAPDDPNQFEYPMPTAQNRNIYEEYSRRAAAVPNLIVCGRLGCYRYFDMDHAIERAMAIAETLLGPNGHSISSTPEAQSGLAPKPEWVRL